MGIGRNDPCICGSGKKYKKCCLGKENKGLDIKANVVKEQNQFISKDKKEIKQPFFEDDIDNLSNSVIDLIEVKNLSKAKEVCQKLLDEYPDQVDGYHRFASVYESEGDLKKAAEYYRKTVDFMRKNEGFDDDGINWYLELAEKMEKENKI